MPTGLSSTDAPDGAGAPDLPGLAERGGIPTGRWSEVRHGVADTGALVRFRTSGLRGRARRVATYGLLLMALLTAAFATVPALVHRDPSRLTDVQSILPTAMVGIL